MSVKEVELLSYLPFHIRELKEFKEIAKAETPEIKLILEAIDKFLRNMFIETADEDGIAYFESLLGIFPEENDTLENRRFRVYLRWNIRKNTLNESLTVLLGVDGVKTELQGLSLTVKVALTEKNKVNEVRQLLERMLPAIMMFTVSLLYNQWGSVKHLKWGEVKGKTWGQLRNEVL